MEDEKVATLELNEKTDLLATEVKCPTCGAGKEYMTGVPYVNVSCRKCNTKYRTDFKQDIYTKKARQLNGKISWKDKLIIRASEKYEKEINHIRADFIRMKCWDVSELRREEEEYRYCQCGVCLSCLTCKKCGKTFERDPNKRKYTCPHCRSTSFVKTYFKEVFSSEENPYIRLCPHCNSDRIRLTRSKYKSKCHICGSKKLSDTKINIVFILEINRKVGYKI